MVRLVRGLVRLEEREELLRARGTRALRLGGGLRGRGGEGRLGGVPGGELAREVGGEGGRLGRGREGVVLDDADVGVLGLEEGKGQRERFGMKEVAKDGKCRLWAT